MKCSEVQPDTLQAQEEIKNIQNQVHFKVKCKKKDFTVKSNLLRLVHLFSNRNKKGKIVASCPALQVTNVSECGLCRSVFSWFYRTVFLVLVYFDFFGFMCVLCMFFSNGSIRTLFTD